MANHTTPIDVVILQNDITYALVGGEGVGGEGGTQSEPQGIQRIMGTMVKPVTTPILIP